MTFEEEREFTALSDLFAARNKSLSYSEIVAFFAENFWEAEFISHVFRELLNKSYLKITDEHIVVHSDGSKTESLNKAKYTLTKYGIEMYLYKAKEKGREDLETKVKALTLESIRYNKYFPLWALIVALLAVVAPIIYDYFKPEKEIEYKLEKQQMKELQEVLQSSKSTLLPVQDSFPLDSSTTPKSADTSMQ